MLRSLLTALLVPVLAFGSLGCPAPAPEEEPPAPPDAQPAPPARDTGDVPADADPGDRMTVTIYFTRDEEPVPVQRSVPRTDAVLRASLEALLAGPTAAEVERGVTSWFSEATVGMLQQVRLQDGHATVDFADFSRVVPGASSSAGSTILLGELNSTVFELELVESVEYRFQGSCDAFWNWLQYECQVVHRADVRQLPG